MNDAEIDALVQEQFLCRIGFNGKNSPYIAPFQYVVHENNLYFHFTDYGDKMVFFEEGKLVCVEIEKYTPNLSQYSFVVYTGKLKLVNNSEERKMVIEKMGEAGSSYLSSNFLAAHGFKEGSEWASFSSDQPLLIVKLEKTSRKGLKSP